MCRTEPTVCKYTTCLQYMILIILDCTFFILLYIVYCMYTLHYSSNKIKFSIQGNILKINITQYLRKNEIPLDLTLVRFFL